VRVAIATDQDFVAAQFGCCPMCTIADVIDGNIARTFIIPNPGCNHEFWADLFFRNRVTHVLAGTMGTTAEAALRGRGIKVILGVHGDVGDAVSHLFRGDLTDDESPAHSRDVCCRGAA
jgi:predicted Fe-Mo cluster-binding NifX family protein